MVLSIQEIIGTTVSSQEEGMRVAIQLAEMGEGKVSPNPMVGCVVVRDGSYHRRWLSC